MASESPNKEYVIYRHEKIGLLDILSLLIFRRCLLSYKFVEISDAKSVELRNVQVDSLTARTLLCQKFLSAISKPLKSFGGIIEFLLNLVAFNGGILRFILSALTGKIKIPDPEAAYYRSIIAYIDDRLDLYKSKSFIGDFPLIEPKKGRLYEEFSELTMMASKVAYENAAYIEEAVTDHWKMHFVGFYSCWNKFLNNYTTQAFIFCDKAEDANYIVLAFRGTEPFNAKDWVTDIDLSMLYMGKLGYVHLGFLKALGLQDEKDYRKGFPKDFPVEPDQPIAYYTLRAELKLLLRKHKNAKIVITGHSLGGALATIFLCLLAMHDQVDILKSLLGVLTFGQPRVGNAGFQDYVDSVMISNYYRMVYRFDIVPRVPLDIPIISPFKHGGICMYYNGWYERKEDKEVPNPNYIDPKYIIPMYLNAWGDLIKAFFLGKTQGKDFKEGIISLLYRALGLIVPGVASHSPRDYVNAGRLAKMTAKEVFYDKSFINEHETYI
ncbi:uncharacterized protein LOC109706574 [Ananas comosus]|uniref:Lipase n=1 Tax=Ananas comosus TaxID=4615 RepID=A0A199W6W7_ANACO|nr:uncharacterized protein LOC109706574 [Ananas comosus]OAY84986.1 Lipase [Ananas comosus]